MKRGFNGIMQTHPRSELPHACSYKSDALQCSINRHFKDVVVLGDRHHLQRMISFLHLELHRPVIAAYKVKCYIVIAFVPAGQGLFEVCILFPVLFRVTVAKLLSIDYVLLPFYSCLPVFGSNCHLPPFVCSCFSHFESNLQVSWICVR